MEYASAVEEAIGETRSVLTTFNAMLRISKVEDGHRRAGFEMIDLAGIAADVAEFHEPVAEEKGVSLQLDLGGSVSCPLRGDASLLFEAVSNLVDNAIKYTPPGGTVRITMPGDNARKSLSVIDSGPGIPAEERDAVLRRFYRMEKSRHTPGTGLGLSLVIVVARLHGLKLLIEDADPGCRVTLTANSPDMQHPPLLQP